MSEKTHWKKLQDPNYFGAWSIPEHSDLILTIDYITVEEVISDGGRKEQKPVLYFKEPQKPLVLNVTNSRQIESIYGSPYIEDWGGKQIQLFQSTTKLKGEEVDCVRIRAKVPNQKKPSFTPEIDRWKKAVDSIANGESTIEAIKKYYELSDKHEALLKKDIADMVKKEESLA